MCVDAYSVWLSDHQNLLKFIPICLKQQRSKSTKYNPATHTHTHTYTHAGNSPEPHKRFLPDTPTTRSWVNPFGSLRRTRSNVHPSLTPDTFGQRARSTGDLHVLPRSPRGKGKGRMVSPSPSPSNSPYCTPVPLGSFHGSLKSVSESPIEEEVGNLSSAETGATGLSTASKHDGDQSDPCAGTKEIEGSLSGGGGVTTPTDTTSVKTLTAEVECTAPAASLQPPGTLSTGASASADSSPSNSSVSSGVRLPSHRQTCSSVESEGLGSITSEELSLEDLTHQDWSLWSKEVSEGRRDRRREGGREGGGGGGREREREGGKEGGKERGKGGTEGLEH